ncbi:GGDEF domain-containing protein [Sedimenticola hydrogenitrophicus]|uniref:GGDEF domain-containing protein n=1 Tax=Sedimenticola hydrogenitrophicus TaxID=2967975 RepID=UPI0021A93255|nr:GGDEF domain-containing protein [Sedimenticola hydrogenitrophicus]
MAQSDGEWKKKYFDSLADLERKEKRWQSVESTLRRCLSRLSFVGDGMDAQLDERLEQLRNRVRGEQDTRALLRLVEDIAGRAEGVNARPGGGPASETVETCLARVLDAAVLPGALGRRAEKLSRELKRSPTGGESVKAATALILEALARQPAASEGPGLIGKLFSREKEGGVGGGTKAAPDEGPPSVQSPEGQDLFTSLVNQLISAGQQPALLRPILDQAGRAISRRALDDLVTELVAVLSETAGSPPPASDSLPPLDQVLLQLVQLMTIPVALQPRMQALKSRLGAGMSAADVSPILSELVELSEHARIQAEQERQEVERFLLQMTEQLQRLDQEVNGLGSAGSALTTGNRRLDSEMQGQVTQLRASVEQATDLDELKVAIAHRLDLIQDRLRGQRSESERQILDFQQRIDLLTTRLGDMEQEAVALRKHVDEARSEAFTDALTGLNNRHAFDCRLQEEFVRWSRYQYPLSMIVIDVDHFKKVNDTHGHLAGDKVLHVIGTHLKQATRQVDFPARYGGEEFVILLPEVDLTGAGSVAEKIRRAVEEKPFHSGDNRVNITVSCGVSTFHKGDGRKSPFKRADEALYLAKRQGRNRCRTEDQVEKNRAV